LKKLEKNWANLIYLILLISSLLLISSCSNTIIPKRVSVTQPSFDGNVQNSGFLGFTKEGGGIITENARERYNFLVSQYGTNYIPPLTLDAGVSLYPLNSIIYLRNKKVGIVTNTVFQIDAQHLSYFLEMNDKWRNR